MENRKATVLVVDDELSIRESFNLILEDKYKVITAASGEAALKKAVDEKVDLVYLDIRMPGMDGMETLKRLREIDKDSSVIMVTAVNDVQNAGEAIKLGAKNYIVKPFDVDEILGLTERTLKKKAFTAQTREIRGNFPAPEDDLIGTSKQIEEIRAVAQGLAERDVNVLISGERGVEVDLLARVLHNRSGRALKPFITLHIGNESDEALRKALFGSGTGSFVATLEKEKGLFEAAGGGTLFLVNVENLSPALQKELGTAFKEKEFAREGSLSPIPLDVRVICSTNSNLKELAQDGTFDMALFEKLGEGSIELPPLRERSSDTPLFVEHFINKYNKVYGRSINAFTKDALETLSGYDFPGNVLELECIIEEIALTFDVDEVGCENLPLYLLLHSNTFRGVDESRNINFEVIYDVLEKNYVEHVLEISGTDTGRASEYLGLEGRALASKIESLKPKK